MESQRWIAREMLSGNFDIADNDTGKTVARTDTAERARLIAAAPETAAERDRLREINAEMLEVLEALLEEADQMGGSVRRVTRYEVDRARAAIRKARGEA